MPLCYIGRWIPHAGRFLRSTVQLMHTSGDAQRRAHILTFFKKHGLAATRDAFSVSRSTLYEWRQRLSQGEGRLSALEPQSRRPHHLRTPDTPHPIVTAVCQLRRACPHLGKDKIADLLQKAGVVVSSSTVGRIIRRFDLPSAPRQYVARNRKKGKKKPRLPQGFEALEGGELVSLDAIILQQDHVRRFILVALDHATRICIARVYPRLSSRQAKDLLQRMQAALGCPIQATLTDNGSEFHAEFEQACKELSIIHYWTCPRSPKMNARTERMNRTIQEEARFPSFSAPLEEWNVALTHYLMQYNFFRPHAALAYRCPVDQYLSCLNLPPSQSRMWWTHTAP